MGASHLCQEGKDKKKEFFSGFLLPNSRILLPADAGAFSADSVIFTIPESFRCSVPSFPVRLRADGGLPGMRTVFSCFCFIWAERICP